MPNLLIGLKYSFSNPKAETEQQLLQVFADLRKQYQRFSQNFSISTIRGLQIENFENFLRLAVQKKQSVVLKGSGDIGGLNVKDASVEYDLSFIGDLTEYWDIYRDGSCHSCHNHYYQQFEMETEHACNVMPCMDWSGNCPKHDSYRKNSEGKPSRKLDELITEAAK